MKIKLHEIELGSADLQSSKSFYQSVLGLSLSVDQPDLNVFDSGTPQLDLNFSRHLPSGIVMLSFICNNLEEAMQSLTNNGITFEGPVSSHLEMISISFRDPAGYLIKINQATETSPDWLKNSLDK